MFVFSDSFYEKERKKFIHRDSNAHGSAFTDPYLTLSSTYAHFYTLQKIALGKHCRKG